MNREPDITELLVQLEESEDDRVVDRLFPLVYDELRRLAGARMREERPDHTLQATALVNEAYMKLVDQRRFDRSKADAGSRIRACGLGVRRAIALSNR